MNTRICALLVIVALCLATWAHGKEPATGEPLRKRYIWQPGTTTYYRHTSKSETSMSADDQEPATKSSMTIMVRQEVYSVKDDGTGRVAVTLTQLRNERTDAKGKAIVFDSREPEKADEDQRKVYGAMAGRTLIMEITPDGRVLRTEGVEEMMDAMFAVFDDLKGDLNIQPAMQQLRKGMEQTISQAVAIGSPAPSQGHRIGEEWTTDEKEVATMFGEMTGKTVHKIQSIDMVDGRRIMTTKSIGQSTMKPSPERPTAQKPAPGEFVMPFPKVQSQMVPNGLEVFDLDRGRLIRSEDTQDTTGSMTFTLPDMSGHDAKAKKTETRPLKSKTTSVIELVQPEQPLVPEGVR